MILRLPAGAVFGMTKWLLEPLADPVLEAELDILVTDC